MGCCYTILYWSYKILFCCSRVLDKFIKFENTDNPKYNSVNPSKAPWLWVGVEMVNGEIITVTDDINKHILYDDIVDIEYLESVTKIRKDVSRWLYLDSKTLKEEEFPLNGLVIPNDSIQ